MMNAASSGRWRGEIGPPGPRSTIATSGISTALFITWSEGIALAEDIHQEIWLAALEGIERYDAPQGRFRDWLMGIARHRVSRHMRKATPHAAGLIFDWGIIVGASGLPHPNQLESLECAGVIRAAMLCLNPDQRDVLVRKYIDNSSVQEIAKLSGRSVKAVESLLSRRRRAVEGVTETLFFSPFTGNPL